MPTDSEIKTIVITNPTDSAQYVWLSRPLDANFQGSVETSFQVNAQSTLELPLSNADSTQDYRSVSFVHVKAQSTALTASVVDITGQSTDWPKGNSASYQEFNFFSQTADIINLTPFEQTFEVNNESLTLPGFGKIRKEMPAGNLKASGTSRFLVAAISPSIHLARMDSTPVTIPTPTEGHFFLLSNGPKNQSYVVNLTDPQMIAQAQDQIKNPTAPGGRILMAQIGKNSGGVNRNFNDPKKTPWSWHVDKALHFAELGAQDCDGSPEMIEELIAPYMANNGTICFWSYRIIKELSADEVSH